MARNESELFRNVQVVRRHVGVAYFLEELLVSSDEEEIIVIQPSACRGGEVVVNNVRNGYHLFALLEGVLAGSSGKGLVGELDVSREEIAIARGEKEPGKELVLRARFDYFNWSAWGKDGCVVDAPTRWIWGDMPISVIPRVEGKMIVLMEAPRYKRTWDANLICRVHPLIRSSAVVGNEIEEFEVKRLLDLFGSASTEDRDRLKYAGVTG